MITTQKNILGHNHYFQIRFEIISNGFLSYCNNQHNNLDKQVKLKSWHHKTLRYYLFVFLKKILF